MLTTISRQRSRGVRLADTIVPHSASVLRPTRTRLVGACGRSTNRFAGRLPAQGFVDRSMQWTSLLMAQTTRVAGRIARQVVPRVGDRSPLNLQGANIFPFTLAFRPILQNDQIVPGLILLLLSQDMLHLCRRLTDCFPAK